jgi:hypothetical protein
MCSPCTLKSDEEENSKCAGLAHEIGFCSYISGQCDEARKRRNIAVHLLEKSVINVIGLVLPVSDWPTIMNGTGGLLLVGLTYLQS